MGVAGVGIGTVISQFVSCVLVLRCLHRSETCYQLHFSGLKMQKKYLWQIFRVGVPAGIQSMVINFSNALLQSSVNSFGSIAMAGYTAANNLLGFLYVSVNAVTQACMSFTSQNYGAGKYKRMDRVLADCMILVGRGGIGAWLCRILFRTSDFTDLHRQFTGNRKWNGDSFDHYYTVFFVRYHGSDPWGAAGRGVLGGTYDPVCDRYSGDPDRMDLSFVPIPPFPVLFVYFLSGILAVYHFDAGGMFLLCTEKDH